MKNLIETQGVDVKKMVLEYRRLSKKYLETIEIIKGWKGLMEQGDCLTAKMASLTISLSQL